MNEPRAIKTILFVRSTLPDQRSIVPPLGILYLVGALRRDLGPEQPEMEVLNYGLERYNLRMMAARLREFDPDLVAISGLTVEAELIASIARLAREGRPDRVVVAGGPHASSDPGGVLSTGWVDYAVIGEGEETLPALVRCLRGGGDPGEVAGMARLVDGEPARTPKRPQLADLDTLPEPAWDTIPVADYSAAPSLVMSQSLQQAPSMVLMSSRGCPFGCTYCHKYFGRKVRGRSPESVLAEMTRLYRDFGVREFHIIDDFFNFDLERAKTICRMIAESGMEVSLAFPNGIRGDRMDNELLEAMKRAGTYKIYFAVESGSPRIQKLIGKGMNLEAIDRTISRAASLGINTAGFFMLGFPTETREEMERTIRFAVRSRLTGANFFKVVPFPGTKLARLWADTYGAPEGGGGEEDYRSFYFLTRELPVPEERLKLVNAMHAKAYLRFYGNPLRSGRFLVRHPNRRHALQNLGYMARNLFRHYRDRWLRPQLFSREQGDGSGPSF